MKKMYQADAAQKQYKKQYKSTLREARIGISLTDEQLSFLEETIVPLLKNGLSIPACYEAYADSMPVSIRTLYELHWPGPPKHWQYWSEEKTQKKAGEKEKRSGSARR